MQAEFNSVPPSPLRCARQSVSDSDPVLVLELPLVHVFTLVDLLSALLQHLHQEAGGLVGELLDVGEGPEGLPAEQLEDPVHQRVLAFHLHPPEVRLLPAHLALVAGTAHVGNRQGHRRLLVQLGRGARHHGLLAIVGARRREELLVADQGRLPGLQHRLDRAALRPLARDLTVRLGNLGLNHELVADFPFEGVPRLAARAAARLLA
mmetsp:Transcript_874/g.2236  ORF Transcript_874/g.2236 Transcript_874/m.2236 type:complete len:207 (+) Transcript_874:88-708(+)